ncbi:hypothetical protein [Sulfurimonas sp.]
MRYTIMTIIGLLIFGFLGCATHHVKTDKSKKLLEKPQKKIINDYKTTIYKNVAKSKDKKKKLAMLKKKKEKLLNRLKLLQESYPLSKDKTSLNKQRSKITKELTRIQKEYKELESKVVVVNYTKNKNIKKD